MRKIALTFILLALTASVSYSAEEKLNNSLVMKLMSQLPKNAFTQLQSTLKNKLEWQKISPACSFKFFELLSTELAQAFPMLDALGKPGSGLFLGNFFWPGAFSECEGMKKFQYCLAGFSLKMYTFSKKVLDTQGVLGTCMPQECNQSDIRIVLNMLPLKLNYPPYIKASITFPQSSGLSIYGNTVLCEERDKSYSVGTKTMLAICGFLLAMCLLGTAIELLIDWLESPLACIYSRSMPLTLRSFSDSNALNGTALVDEANSLGSKESLSGDLEQLVPSPPVTHSLKDSLTLKLFLCFSLVKNTKAVLNTNAPDRAILSINGIRTISMMWVILGHCYAIGETTGGLENIADLLKVLRRFTFLSVENAFFSVDSFFLLSGLLVSYLGLKRLESKGKLPLWKFYLHRYIRLTPTYGFVILFFMYLLPLIGKGPMWSTITTKTLANTCKDYWWTNLLYINNFYPTQLAKECIGWGWYLANDMQFYVISPIILYGMYKLRLRGALIFNGYLIAVSALVTGLLINHYKLKALEVVADISSRPKNGPSFEDIIYTKPYCRIQPYLVGLMLGYFLFKKYKFQGTFKWLWYLIGWVVAIVLGMTVVYGTWGTSKAGGRPFSNAENIFYASLSRLTWALAVAWVIFACQNKFGGLVQNFLSWRAFMPLSRLTYGAYLIHPMTLLVFYQSKLSTRAYTDLDLAFQFVSITVMSYAAAFILAVTVEYPILNIDKWLFS